MHADTIATPAPVSDDASTIRVTAALIVAVYAATFALCPFLGRWLFDEAGRPIASDFINVWAAGRLALEGHAPQAYDWGIHKGVEILATGYPFGGYFGWHYPPPFLMIAAPLALFSYPVAQLIWMAATAPLYATAVRTIAGKPGAAVAALAFPAVAWNFACGQNGFLTAALLGGGLALLPRRPVLAGVLIGLLTYKPQFGLLIPLALIAGGHWRAFGSAAASAVLLAAASYTVFGLEAWRAFLGSLPVTNNAVLVNGWADFVELLSPFGLTRWLGGGVAAGWTAQAAAVAILAAAVWRVWRSEAAFTTKAALLGAATLISSPYIYIYDFTALAIAIAFLARGGCSSNERTALAVVCLLLLGGPQTGLPITILAAPIVVAIALSRYAAETQPAARLATA